MLGLYDSGSGGKTILKEILRSSELKNLDIIYFEDRKNLPLGDKNDKEILKIVTEALKVLFDLGCNLVILACNTATSVSIKYIQNYWLPNNYPKRQVLGIIRPITEYLNESKIDKNLLIGLMGTQATINSGFIEQELIENNFKNILKIPCPGLADSIETKNNDKINLNLKDCFSKIKSEISKLDILLLVCTHYPIIKKQIKIKLISTYKVNMNLQIIDQGLIASTKLQKYLKDHPEYFMSFNKKVKYIINN